MIEFWRNKKSGTIHQAKEKHVLTLCGIRLRFMGPTGSEVRKDFLPLTRQDIIRQNMCLTCCHGSRNPDGDN